MKVKLSLDKDAIQEFFVHHVEKILFAGVVLCFLFFIYGAARQERFASKPRDLVDAANNARKHLEETNPEAKLMSRDFAEKATKLRIPIAKQRYEHRALWKPLLFAQRAKRGEPQLYPVQDLRGAPGSGALRMAEEESTFVPAPEERGPRRRSRDDDEEDEEREIEIKYNVKGFRWVCVTGLVPITEQEKAYRQLFRDAQFTDPERDYPDYIYYRVERAEVTSGGEADLEWNYRVNLRQELARLEEFGEGGQQMVNPEYLHPDLAYPLPPLVGQNWGPEVAHPPEIPLARNEQRSMMQPPVEEEEEQAAPDEDLPDLPDLADGKSRPAGRRPAARRAGSSGRMVTAARRRPRGGYGGEGYMEMGMGMGMEGPYAGGTPQKEQTPYLLFRFFDFNVEPGKQYRYRVRLLLRNPNYEVEPRFLERPELAKKQWIETDWCEPSDAVIVPRDDRLLAVSANPPRRLTDEPSAKLCLVQHSQKYGMLVHEDWTVMRGQVLNRYDRSFEGTLPGSGARIPMEDVDFKTDAVLLDIRGGKSRDQSSPAQVLVLDHAGRLVVRNELTDLAEYESLEAPAETGYPGGMEGMPGMMDPEMMPPEMMPGEGDLHLLEGGYGPAYEMPEGRRSRSRRSSGRDRD